MKKPAKILGIIALTVVIGFSITACSDDAGNGPEPPKTFITVTDIPPAYDGKIGAIFLYLSDPSDIAVYSTEEKINGTSSVFPLYNWKNEKPWTGSESYRITILIFENKTAAANKQYIYAGSTTENISITEENTDIEWSLFTDKTPRENLLNAYFQKR